MAYKIENIDCCNKLYMNYEFVNFEITKNLFYKNDSFYPLDLFSFNENEKK